MDKLLISYIEPYIEGYIEDLNREQITKSISSGNIKLDNIKLSSGILEKLNINFPLKLVNGNISNLYINIPWTKIMMGESIMIEIDGISLLFALTKEEEWLSLDKTSYKNKLAYLQTFSNQVIKHLENHFYKNTGFFNFAMFSSITDNVKVTITNVKLGLIYNDDELSLNIDKMAYLNTDQEYSKPVQAVKNAEYGYKLVSIDNFSILNKNFNNKEIFIIKPLNMKLEVKVKSQIKNNEHKFTFNLILDSLDFELEKRQVDMLIAIMNEYLYYKKKLFQFSQNKKFLIFKPRLQNTGNEAADRREYNLNMWRFAFRMLKKLNRFYKGVENVFDITTFTKNKYEAMFIDFYAKYINKTITADEEAKLKWITDIIDTNTISCWLDAYITSLFIELKKSKTQAKGVFNFFGLGAADNKKIEEVKLTIDEINKMNELIKKNIEEGLDENELVPKFELVFNINTLKCNLHNEKLTQNLSVDLNKINLKVFYGIENFNIAFSLGHLNVQFFEKQKNYPVTYNKFDYKNDGFIVLNIDKTIVADKKTMTIQMNVNQIDFLYGNYITVFILCYLKCHITNELIRLIVEHWGRLKYSARESLKKYLNYKRDITFSIKSKPIKLILPTRSDLDKSSLFIIDLNNFLISKTEKESIGFNFEDINIGFYNSFDDFNKASNKIDVLKNLTLTNELSYHYKIDKEEERLYALSSNINKLNLVVTNNVYQSIFLLVNSFDLENQGLLKVNPELVNIPSTEIKSNSILSGYVLKLNNILKTWEVYFIHISGGFIYFYNKPGDDDYIFRVYINEESMKITIEGDIVIMSSISFYVQMKMPNDFNNKTIILEHFIKAVNQQISENVWEEIDHNKKPNLLKTSASFSSNLKESGKKETLYLKCDVAFNEINLTLCENNLIPILNTQLKAIKYSMNLNSENEIEIDFSVNSLYLKTVLNDILVHHAKPDKNIMHTKIRIYDTKSKNFVDTTCSIQIQFRNFVLYYRPELIQSLINLFKINKELLYSNEFKKLRLNQAEDKLITCIDYSNNLYKNIHIDVKFKKINIILIQEILDIMYYDIDLTKIHFTSSIYYDHKQTTFDIGKLEISDLTGYPHTIKSQNEFDANSKNTLMYFPNQVSIKLNNYNKSCPFERTASEDTFMGITLDTPIFYYIYQPYERFTDYVFNEYEKIEFKLYERFSQDISMIRLDFDLNNPLIILKDEKASKDQLIFDFGHIKVTNKYDYEMENQQQILYQNIFLELNGMTFKSIINNKEFYLINKTDLKGKMYYKAIDNDSDEFRLLKFEDDEYSSNIIHYLYDLASVDVNLRQLDMHYMILFMDKNLNFKDGNNKLFKLKDKTGKLAKQAQNETILNINQININLLINFNHYFDTSIENNGSFFQIKISDLVMIQKLLKKESIAYTIGEIFITSHHKGKTEFILQNNKKLEKEYQLELILETNEQNESYWNITFNNFKFLFKLDNILLLNDFIMNAYPDYSPKETEVIESKKKQFKNIGDWFVTINMNKSMFILLSDDESNAHQTIVCSNIGQLSVIFKHIKRKNVINNIKAKKLTRDLALDISISMDNLNVYITKFFNLQENEFNKRYLMRNTDSIYIFRLKNLIRYDLLTQNFIDEYSIELDIESLNFNLSYTDIVTFLNAYFANLCCLNTDSYIQRKELLRVKDFEFNDLNNIVLIEKFNMTEVCSIIILKKITITLIDDNSNIYYPFLSLRLNNIDATIINSEISKTVVLDSLVYLEAMSYNYITSTWEPLLENSVISVNFKRERNDKCNKTILTLGGGMNKIPLKFNISDMNVNTNFNLVHFYLFIVKELDYKTY
jgi:hypothetical protein